MRQRRGAALAAGAAVLVCVVGLALAPGALAQSTGSANESSFGAQVSSFMQSSAADANGTIDRGMWAAGVNASAADAAVSQRAARLEARLQTLENQTSALAAMRENGTLSGVAYTARASAVRAQLANVRAAVDQTSTTAQEFGVNATTLGELRAAAGNATGPEIAAIARNVSDAGRSPPDWARGDGEPPGGGPPDDGPGANRGNGTGDGPSDGAGDGKPADPGQGDGEAPGGSGDGKPADPGKSGDRGS